MTTQIKPISRLELASIFAVSAALVGGYAFSVYYYLNAVTPRFTVIEDTHNTTRARYSYPKEWPRLVSLESSAIDRFRKNLIGEKIILEEDKPDGKITTLKRLSKQTRWLHCADFEVTVDQNAPREKSVCTHRYHPD
jgi:hypothetical protein